MINHPWVSGANQSQSYYYALPIWLILEPANQYCLLVAWVAPYNGFPRWSPILLQIELQEYLSQIQIIFYVVQRRLDFDMHLICTMLVALLKVAKGSSYIMYRPPGCELCSYFLLQQHAHPVAQQDQHRLE
jgi:hypothetical protein